MYLFFIRAIGFEHAFAYPGGHLQGLGAPALRLWSSTVWSLSQARLATSPGDALVNAKVSKHNSTEKKQNGPCFKCCEPQYFQVGLLCLFIISSVLARPS